MKEITAEYEAVLDSLEDDLGHAGWAFEQGDWQALIARSEALIAGARVLETWDREREQG